MDIRVIKCSEDWFNLIGCTRKKKEYIKPNLILVQLDNGEVNFLDKNDNDKVLIYDNKSQKFDNEDCFNCYKNVYGSLWQALSNPEIKLCTVCYFSSTNVIKKDFIRIDASNEIGIYVGPKISAHSTKYYGMSKESVVLDDNGNEWKIVGFVEKEGLPRSFIEIKSGEKKITKKYGYKGSIDLKLKETQIQNKVNEYNIIKSHLRILSRPVYFNYEVLNKYKEEIYEDLLTNNTTNQPIYEVNDEVYCINFTKNIQEYQYKLGKVVNILESEGQIEVHINSSNIITKASKLHKIKDTEELVKLISSKSDFLKIIETWKENFDLKTYNCCWIPESSMFELLKDNVGVARNFTKDGKIILIKYFSQPYNFYILMPKEVCKTIDRTEAYNPAKSEPAFAELYEAIKKDDSDLLKQEIDKRGDFSDFRYLINQSLVNLSLKCFEYLKFKTKPIECMIHYLKEDKNLSIRHLEFIKNQLDTIDLNQDEFDRIALNSVKQGNSLLIKYLIGKDRNVLQRKKVLNMDIFFHALLHDKNRDELFDLLMKNYGRFDVNFQYECLTNNGDIENYKGQNLKFCKNDTLLHICIRNGFIWELCMILEHFKDKVDIKITNDEGNSLSHETALFTDKTKWIEIMNNQKPHLINEICKKFETFSISQHYYLEKKLPDIPHYMLTMLIFENVKDSFIERGKSINCRAKTPLNLLKTSLLKECNKDVSPNVLSTFMNLLFKKQIPEGDLCQFCHSDYATVTYSPCGHTLYCRYCAFMPNICNKKDCGQDIEEFQDSASNEIISWENIETISDTRNLVEYMKEFEKLKEEHICNICKVNDWDTAFLCGHLYCRDCCTKVSGECPTCKRGSLKDFITLIKN